MARKKEKPKPLFSLRHDFVESLENVCQQSLMLLQAVSAVLKHEDLRRMPQAVRDILRERHDALLEALSSEG